eukprot:2089648-Rhodomonas_salina.1
MEGHRHATTTARCSLHAPLPFASFLAPAPPPAAALWDADASPRLPRRLLLLPHLRSALRPAPPLCSAAGAVLPLVGVQSHSRLHTEQTQHVPVCKPGPQPWFLVFISQCRRSPQSFVLRAHGVALLFSSSRRRVTPHASLFLQPRHRGAAPDAGRLRRGFALRFCWGARSRAGSGRGLGAGAGAGSFAGVLVEPIEPALNTEHAVEDCPENKQEKAKLCHISNFSQPARIVGVPPPIYVPGFPCERDEVDREQVQGVVRPVWARPAAGGCNLELLHEQTSPAGVVRAPGSGKSDVSLPNIAQRMLQTTGVGATRAQQSTLA